MFIQRFILVLAAMAAANQLVASEPAHETQKTGVADRVVVEPIQPIAQPNDALAAQEVINAKARNAIPNQYIVLFKPGTKPDEVNALEKQVQTAGGKILFRYRTGILGFAAHLEPDVLEMVLANPHVQQVEADQRMKSSAAEPAACLDAALPAGIDRIDQRLLPLNGTAQFKETGKKVHAYVIDSGIRITHQEFGNRASNDYPATKDKKRKDDCSGHGTHIAGTLGGEHYGVARNVRLHSVRVMDCKGEGTASGVIDGVTWVTAHSRRPAVANMSISGFTELPALEAAIQASIDSGVTYVVAAHNSARNACNYSPARIPNAITVGAVNPRSDVQYITSNDGACLDLFAPGVAILSAGIADDTAKACLSGTSMAAAHVAGVAALYLQLNPDATPSDVWKAIHSHNNIFSATPTWPGILNLGPGSPNEMLHWGPLSGVEILPRP